MKSEIEQYRRVRLELSGKELIDLICGRMGSIMQILDQNGKINIPSNASVTFKVPSGGDYSGESLGISTTHPIVISWTEDMDVE